MTLTEAAQILAQEDYQDDESLEAVYLAEDPEKREIRFVEVSSKVPDVKQCLPFRTKLDLSVYITTVILSPTDWQKLTEGKIQLPASWHITPDQLQKIEKT